MSPALPHSMILTRTTPPPPGPRCTSQCTKSSSITVHFKTVHSTVQWRRVEIKTVHCCHLTPSASRSIIAGLYNVVKSCASVWYCSSEGYSLVECMAAAQHLWHQSNICGTKLIFPKSKQAAQGCYKQRALSSPPQCCCSGDAHLGDVQCTIAHLGQSGGSAVAAFEASPASVFPRSECKESKMFGRLSGLHPIA